MTRPHRISHLGSMLKDPRHHLNLALSSWIFMVGNQTSCAGLDWHELGTSRWETTKGVTLIGYHAWELRLRIVHVWVFFISKRFWSGGSSHPSRHLERTGLRRIFVFNDTWFLCEVDCALLLIFIFTYFGIDIIFLFRHSRWGLIHLIDIHTWIASFQTGLFFAMLCQQI